MRKRHRHALGKIAQRTGLGKLYWADSASLLGSKLIDRLKGKVQLILTSPPFPLNQKKAYGNLNGTPYVDWLTGLAPVFSDLLSPTGSIVIEIGNAWMPGRPVQSLLHLEALMAFVKNPTANLRLCQEFICYNPARLPSPAQWVTIKRIRATDSFTHIWWMARTDYPKADNRRVLRPYSESMERLLKRKSYNSGLRPSEHRVSKKGFLKTHKGSIVPNLFELQDMQSDRSVRLPNAFSLSNTNSNDHFLRKCREMAVKPHPARMPLGLAAFFIQFLTSRNDLVLDPFAGSNTTGFAAEKLGRRWISIEARREYLKQSAIRFSDPSLKD
jgi:hypothetical protein